MDKKYHIARKLRKNSTIQERMLWKILRILQFKNLKFRRQFPIGEYIVDFVCDEKKIIIEIDGGQNNTPENLEKDNARTEFLKSKGYRVIRFWNNDIKDNIKGVYVNLLEEF
jgi:very-short-patch-repair endonuclease